MDDSFVLLARLTARVETLEQRIAVLEHPSAPTAAASAKVIALLPAEEVFSLKQAGGLFPVIGTAMLGIAGAYLLRYVAESGSFPKLAVVMLALAYGCGWLVWATRVRRESGLASTAYAGTAALILAPMLWELTLRFKFLPPGAAAGILGGFVVAASALSWKRSTVSVVWVANVAAVATALALLIATRDLVPFTAALLVMSLTGEVAANRNRWLGVRPWLAIAIDLASGVLLYTYALPEDSRLSYPTVSTMLLLAIGCAPFVIYATSTSLRTTLQHRKIGVFETGQCVVAFLIALYGVLHFLPHAGTVVVGVFCVTFAAVCYASAFISLDRFPEQRSFHVYATWSAALFLTGTFLVLPPVWLAITLSVAAILAMFAGVRNTRQTLQFHSLIYLVAAGYASGLLESSAQVMAGNFPASPRWILWIPAASAVTCYGIGDNVRGERWDQRLLQLISAILAVGAGMTLIISVIAATLAAPVGSHVASTMVTCMTALVLAFSGSRWQRSELVWLSYGILSLLTAKLLFDDLQHGHAGFIAISITLYAVTLILLPRIVRLGRKA